MNIQLDNETKIKFSNAYFAMKHHTVCCLECRDYLFSGDGDLCAKGKEIIATHLAYADCNPTPTKE